MTKLYEPKLASPSALIERIYRTGHFHNPDKPTGVEWGDLPKLKLHSPQTKIAIESLCEMGIIKGTELAFAEHGRRLHIDGEMGPATERLIMAPRCEHPDYHVPDLPELLYEGYEQLSAHEDFAQGERGNWKGCHGIGNFHCANINVLNNPPAHLLANGRWLRIQQAVAAAFARVGLQLYWGGVGSAIQDKKSGYQLTMQFVNSSSGWIGLAQVVLGQSCNTTHWSRYLATYLRNASEADIIQYWVTLLMHELGHNLGSGHTTGGVMNSHILRLAATWVGDVLWAWLVRHYGGQPIPTAPEPPKPEPPTPEPPGPTPPDAAVGRISLFGLDGKELRRFNVATEEI